MKKIISILLAVMLLAGLGGAAFANDTLSDAEAAEMIHKLYEANRLDEVFSRHESLAVSFTYPDRPDLDAFVWETEDRVYEDQGGFFPCFKRTVSITS